MRKADSDKYTAQNKPSGAIWGSFGHRTPECFKMILLEPSGSHLATGRQNAPKWAFWSHMAAIWPQGTRMPENEASGAIWQPFDHRAPECLKMSLLESPGSHLATGRQNASK